MRNRPAASEDRLDVRHTRRTPAGWPLLLVLLAVTLACYQPAWHGQLLWDDDAHITRSDLQSLDGLRQIWLEPGATQQYYPLLHSAFWVFHALWGTDTLGYHLVSIVLHACSASLLAAILGRLAVPWPWLAALLFALHPVHVESVAWISELKNTLSGTLALASTLAYLRFDRTRRRSTYGLALALFVLALLSKTVTAALPAVLLVVIWWQRGRVDSRRDLAPLAPLFALAVVFGSFTVWVEHTLIGAHGAGFELTLAERVLLAGRAWWFYLGTLVWPSNLTFVYPRWDVSAWSWWQVLWPTALAMLLAAAWLWRSRSRTPLAALLCYSAALAPALGFVNVYPFRYSFVADHFQYLASTAIIVLVAGGLGVFSERVTRGIGRPAQARQVRPVAVTTICVLVVPLAILTWRQAHDYADEETLYRATIRRSPTSWMAHNNLAALKLGTSTDEAMRLLDEALRLNPAYPEAHDNRGLALQLKGRHEDALAEHAEALRLEPAFAEAHNNLGSALQKLGRLPEAAARYREVIRLRPESPLGYANLGNVLLEMDRPKEALTAYEDALRLDPSLVDVRYNTAAALAKAGRGEEALRRFREVLAARPDSADAHASMGAVLERAGRLDDAVSHYEASARLRPQDAQARIRLGNALYAKGELQRAADEYAESLRLEPRSAEAHNNLGASLERLGRLREALDHYEETARLLPGSAEARANLRRAAALFAKRPPR